MSGAGVTSAAVIVVGNEILSGSFADENGAYLIPRLRAKGIRLGRLEIVPDTIDAIADSVARAVTGHDLVFTSGGVGPTHDDVTLAGVAHAFGVPLVQDPTLGALLSQHLGNKLNQAHLRMAMVPRGALVEPGAGWPLVRFGKVVVLPGVPKVFQRKADAILATLPDIPVARARLRCQIDEAFLVESLDPVVAAHPGIAIGSYPQTRDGLASVLVTFEGTGATIVGAALSDLALRLSERGVVSAAE